MSAAVQSLLHACTDLAVLTFVLDNLLVVL